MTRAPDIDWDAQPLGKETDAAIARRLLTAKANVTRARGRRRIPPFQPQGGAFLPCNVPRPSSAPSVPPASPTLPSRVGQEGVILPPETPRVAVSDREPASPFQIPECQTLLPQPAWMERILLIPDCHRPYHDRKAWATMMQAARWFKPHIVVLMGDYLDCYPVSRFLSDPTRRLRLEDELADGRDGLDELDRLGARRKVYILGNHEHRLARHIASNAPDLWGVMPSVPDLLGLEGRGWEVVAYQDGIEIGELYLTHDLGRSGKYALNHALSEAERSVCIAHIHRIGHACLGDPITGKLRQAWSFGWLGDVAQIDYRHRSRARRDYQHGFGLGHLDPDGKAYLRAVPIPRAMVSGRVVRM